MTAKVGAAKVGIRLSPFNTFLQEDVDEDITELVLYLIKELAKLKLLYLHCIEPRCFHGAPLPVSRGLLAVTLVHLHGVRLMRASCR